MNSCIQLNIQVSQGSAATYLKRGGIFFHLLLQFISECKSERIIKIDPRSPKLSGRLCRVFFIHGVHTRRYNNPSKMRTRIYSKEAVNGNTG